MRGASERVARGSSQQPMRFGLLGACGRALYRRAHERMPEHDRHGVPDQPRRDGKVPRRQRDAGEAGELVPHPRLVAVRAGGDEKQPAHVGIQARHPGPERGLDASGAARLSVGRQLEQRERVSGGLPQQAVDRLRRQRRAGREHLPRGFVGEPGEGQLGQLRDLEPVARIVANREQHQDPLGVEPPRREQERLGRRRVDPLEIVDDAHEWLALAGLREQIERRQAEEQAVLDLLGTETEGAAYRGRLGRGQSVDEPDERPEQLLEGGKREIVLGLDPRATEDPIPRLGRGGE